MSDYETHFYEALRQNAIELLENNKEKKGRHLQILTEIMKLRQACCSPRLLDPHSRVVSSKLKVFSEIVEELIGSRHKVLVFSQFIGHLQIIREFLDGRQISYQYLDGSTSSQLRKEQGRRLPGRPGRSLPDQPQGRGTRAQPDRRRLCHSHGSLVEPGH